MIKQAYESVIIRFVSVVQLLQRPKHQRQRMRECANRRRACVRRVDEPLFLCDTDLIAPR